MIGGLKLWVNICCKLQLTALVRSRPDENVDADGVRLHVQLESVHLCVVKEGQWKRFVHSTLFASGESQYVGQ